MTDDNAWKLERTIPMAVVTGIIAQLIVLVWMVAKYDSRLADHDKRLATIETQQQNAAVPLQNISERLARIEGRIEWIITEKQDQKRGK